MIKVQMDDQCWLSPDVTRAVYALRNTSGTLRIEPGADGWLHVWIRATGPSGKLVMAGLREALEILCGEREAIIRTTPEVHSEADYGQIVTLHGGHTQFSVVNHRGARVNAVPTESVKFP
jgi:hypothetical protein